METWFAFVIGSFSVWRITHLLQAEDGPFDLVFKLRKRLGDHFFGHLMDCFLCLSLWISLPHALLLADSWLERWLFWWGLSGATILLERRFSNSKNL